MEFPFETLEVYQKALDLYRTVSREVGDNPSAGDLKKGILQVCQGIVTGASCWSKESKVRYFLQALDLSRCLTPLVEAANIDGGVSTPLRDSLREEIDALSKMLSSLARRTKEWADKSAPSAEGSPPVKTGADAGGPARKKGTAGEPESSSSKMR